MIYLILFLGLLLRVTALHFGLPDLYHADEPIVVNHALAYGTWDFNPHFFKIPPLLSYLLFGVCGISFLLGKIFGFFGTVQDFEYLFYRDPTTFYLLGRLVFGAFVGTISIYLLYRLIARYFSRPVAVASAFFLSVCFLHVRDSHYLYPDIPLVMIMVISFWPFLEIVHRGNTGRLHLISGLLIGMATAMKYNGGSLILPHLFAGVVGVELKKIISSFFCPYVLRLIGSSSRRADLKTNEAGVHKTHDLKRWKNLKEYSFQSILWLMTLCPFAALVDQIKWNLPKSAELTKR